MVSAFDQIGSIIVIRIPPSLHSKRECIGRTLLDNIKIVDRVFCQISDVSGEYRVRNLELIAGSGDTKTTYKENGCVFSVDVEKAFFSPRLSTERARIADMVCDGEMIMNMFGGMGAYSVQIAKKSPCTVYNVDVNPRATELCIESMRHNKIMGKVIPVTDDARHIASTMPDMADRTLMPLPERSDEFLDCAVRVTRNGGIIHYYSHIHADRKQEAAALSAEHLSDVVDARLQVIGFRLVRAVGPRYYQTVVDARIFKV